ncbi:hypothetical protein OK016_19390 [Vibrio chagasii]|nr:hypothetical protein [Vibrio chagasii]
MMHRSSVDGRRCCCWVFHQALSVAARCIGIDISRGSHVAAYVYIITCWNRRGS